MRRSKRAIREALKEDIEKQRKIKEEKKMFGKKKTVEQEVEERRQREAFDEQLRQSSRPMEARASFDANLPPQYRTTLTPPAPPRPMPIQMPQQPRREVPQELPEFEEGYQMTQKPIGQEQHNVQKIMQQLHGIGYFDNLTDILLYNILLELKK